MPPPASTARALQSAAPAGFPGMNVITSLAMAERSTRQAQIEQLRDKGYVVVPRFVAVDGLTKLNKVARAQLAAQIGCSASLYSNLELGNRDASARIEKIADELRDPDSTEII